MNEQSVLYSRADNALGHDRVWHVVDLVIAAYKDLADGPQAIVPLRLIRDRLQEPRECVDAALREIAEMHDAELSYEDEEESPENLAAAVVAFDYDGLYVATQLWLDQDVL